MPRPSSLQRETRQTRPFRSAAEEASLGIVRTAALVRRAVARVVEPSGITPAQYNVLRILRGAGPAGLPAPPLPDKLETAGHVRRARSTPDRRQVICFITPRGLGLLKKLDRVIVRADESGAAGLKPREQRTPLALPA